MQAQPVLLSRPSRNICEPTSQQLQMWTPGRPQCEYYRGFQHAEKVTLPVLAPRRRKQKPCITDATITLVDQRCAAGSARDEIIEKNHRKSVRKLVRNDPRIWLLDLVGSGEWSRNKLRRGPKHRQGRLKNASGDIVPNL